MGDLQSESDVEPAREEAWTRIFLRGAASTVLVLSASLLLFFLVEGAARDLTQADDSVMLEERHTRYDAELGWVSVPGITIPDIYGEGKGLATNSRGFRGEVEVGVALPAGKRRALCSGDSFTLGYGVGDHDAWCARLAALDPALETVNMGQGGYGIGQAFLWYRRDGADLDRSVHLLAFIGDDFERLQQKHFLGYGKPFLELSDGGLVVSNTPAPRRSRLSRWLIVNGARFGKLSSVRVLGSIVARFSGGGQDVGPMDEDTWSVAARIFETLAEENASKNARLVLVFLPTPWDYTTGLYDAWRARTHAFADSTGIPLVDLVDELRKMTKEEVDALFIPEGEIGAPHLNESGNDWVARSLLAQGTLSPLEH